MTTKFEINFEVPDLIAEKVKFSEPFVNYNQNGSLKNVGIDVRLPELHLTTTCSVRDPHLLGAKVSKTLVSWEKQYQRHLDQKDAEKSATWVEDKNRSIAQELEALGGILEHTLSVDDAIDWTTLQRNDHFHMKPESLVTDESNRSLIRFSPFGRPEAVDDVALGQEPTLDSVGNHYGLLARVFQKGKIKNRYDEELKSWQTRRERAEKTLNESTRRYDAAKDAFEKKQQSDNDAVDAMKVRYESGDGPAIEEYCDLVLQNSDYPEQFPKMADLEYRDDSRLLVVDYALPSIDCLPSTESYRFVKSRNETTAKELSAAKRKKLYESVIYQACIRTIHELLEADVINAIDGIAFNGLVTQTNPATGIEETKTILSVMASKDEFLAFDLARVDSKATFKHMKGVSGTALIDLTPVQPIVMMEKGDRRFVDAQAIADSIDESVNLAAMDWEEFEHLVRELFEREFATSGGEVKVTQASSDGGVDAIAFDPDPIRGGKIVIQAKRYTNTVGVAAVRDLYGTVMNEGATKGILVTTSNYGRDSYEFAKDKPLTLLNGQNLLYLLEKHGTKARIDISEAKLARGG